MLSNFFAVPLTVRYLGKEQYGVWVTLTSILAYVAILDLGIGSTAINGVAKALAEDDRISARRQINIVYLTLAMVSIMIALVMITCWPLISWPAVLGSHNPAYKHEITAAVTVAIAVVLIGLPFSATSRVMGACRKVTVSNAMTAAGNLVSLLAIFLAAHYHAGLTGLVLAVSGTSLLVGAINTAWLYSHFEWLHLSLADIRRQEIFGLLRTGLPFFAVQVSGIILFQTDNLIIAQILGAAAVTPYSITWKLFSYATLLQVLALPSLWPAYADAFARKDFDWIRKTYRINLTVALGTTTAFVLLLLFLAKPFIAVWASPAAVPTFGLVLGMGVWTLLSSLSWCESCILGAAGQVKGQATYSAIGAIVNLAASIALGRIYGLTGIIMGTLAAYLLCIIVPQTIEVGRIIRGEQLAL